MSQSHTPHYKTLDVVTFYNQVYDFVSRYLIFVLAGIFSIIIIGIIWIREPDIITSSSTIQGTGSLGYVQETGLIYPVNYFAESSLNFDGDNKIFGLGGPIWRNQGMWNSIDNIVQYNGVILPRQISRSAWVPKLDQEYYSESMIKTFLEGMGTSQVDINSVKLALDTSTKQAISPGSLMGHFSVGCSSRPLFITKFCDLKLLDAISQWDAFDLSGSIVQLSTIYQYLFVKHPNKDIQQARCNAMIHQYRYSVHPEIPKLIEGCSKNIIDETQYIGNMVAVNQEVRSNTFTPIIYRETSVNRYKLMSRYQYLIQRASTDQFTDEDTAILTSYNSYITKLANKGIIAQPYGDIISVFHQQYLIPWLSRRDSFAQPNEKELTKELIKTTDLIMYGDDKQHIISITSGSRIKPIDFLIAHGLYYGSEQQTGSTTSANSQTGETTTPQDDKQPYVPEPTTNEVITESTGSTLQTGSSLDILIAQVLGTPPTSLPIKRGDLIIIKYEYKGLAWIAAVDTAHNGTTQLYYDSPISGATKITHPGVIFNATNSELILAIMNDYISKNQ